MITDLSEIWHMDMMKKGAIPNFSSLSATILDDPNVYDSVHSLVSSTWKSWDRIICTIMILWQSGRINHFYDARVGRNEDSIMFGKYIMNNIAKTIAETTYM